MNTLARAPGGQRRGAATKSMSDIVEERQQSRYAPFGAAPLRAAARRPAGFVARSSHTAPGIARRSRGVALGYCIAPRWGSSNTGVDGRAASLNSERKKMKHSRLPRSL